MHWREADWTTKGKFRLRFYLLMARLMRANFRIYDPLYRFGGEEFVVLMRCDDADKAVYYAKAHGRNQVCSYQHLVSNGGLVEEVAEEMDADLL